MAVSLCSIVPSKWKKKNLTASLRIIEHNINLLISHSQNSARTLYLSLIPGACTHWELTLKVITIFCYIVLNSLDLHRALREIVGLILSVNPNFSVSNPMFYHWLHVHKLISVEHLANIEMHADVYFFFYKYNFDINSCIQTHALTSYL